jgi:N-acetylglucosaminyl-diphospho-decaprenol L-rhamnosyltransferase
MRNLNKTKKIHKITIILVSFFSRHHVLRICKYLNNYKIIIIENSRDKIILKKLKRNKNVKIYFPKKNLGYGNGNNYGIKKSKTKKNLILNPDTIITKKSIKNLINCSENLDNFGILFPRLNNYKSKNYFKNYNKSVSEITYKFVGKDIVSGCGMLINKEKLNNIGYFDKNIFLYKEETDLIKRCTDNSIKCYVLKNSQITHFGSKSHHKNIDLEADLFRNWHWMWSNFYFYNKHFGFSYAFFKFFKKFLSSFVKSNFYFLFKNPKHLIYKSRFNGLISSIMKKSSFYRMNIEKLKN